MKYILTSISVDVKTLPSIEEHCCFIVNDRFIVGQSAIGKISITVTDIAFGCLFQDFDDTEWELINKLKGTLISKFELKNIKWHEDFVYDMQDKFLKVLM